VLGCGSPSPQGATADSGSSATTEGDAAGGTVARGAECGDAGLSDPGLYDPGSPEELADYARRRTACSLTVQLTRRGKPLTIDYAIE
jgi:hypothetical protein